MDVKFENQNVTRSQDFHFGILLVLGGLLLLIGFAPGILLSCILFTIQNGGIIISPDNKLWETMGMELCIGISLFASITLFIFYKKRYASWIATLKKYLTLSAISVGFIIIYVLFVSSAVSKHRKEDLVNENQKWQQEHNFIDRHTLIDEKLQKEVDKIDGELVSFNSQLEAVNDDIRTGEMGIEIFARDISNANATSKEKEHAEMETAKKQEKLQTDKATKRRIEAEIKVRKKRIADIMEKTQ